MKDAQNNENFIEQNFSSTTKHHHNFYYRRVLQNPSLSSFIRVSLQKKHSNSSSLHKRNLKNATHHNFHYKNINNITVLRLEMKKEPRNNMKGDNSERNKAREDSSKKNGKREEGSKNNSPRVNDSKKVRRL